MGWVNGEVVSYDRDKCNQEELWFFEYLNSEAERAKKYIGAGKSESYLVSDESLGSADPPFIDWLRNEGFKLADFHGLWGCTWVYVNITRKMYTYGKPGCALAKVTGNHAITIDEFKTIYNIYKKYEGHSLFDFNV